MEESNCYSSPILPMEASLVVDNKTSNFKSLVMNENGNNPVSTALMTDKQSPSVGNSGRSKDCKGLSLFSSTSSDCSTVDLLILRQFLTALEKQSVSSPVAKTKDSPTYASTTESHPSSLSPPSTTNSTGDNIGDSPVRVYSTALLLQWRDALKTTTSSNKTLLTELVPRVEGPSPYSNFPSRSFPTQFPHSCTGHLDDWWSSRSDLQGSGSYLTGTTDRYFKISSIERNRQQPLEGSLHHTYNLLRSLNGSTDPNASKEMGDANADSNKNLSRMGFRTQILSKSSARSIENAHDDGQNSFFDEMALRHRSNDLALESTVMQQTSLFPLEFSSDGSGDSIDILIQKPFPRYVAALTPANLGILPGDMSTTSSRRILPFGHPNYFAWLKSLSHNEFVCLARSVARYRRTSRLYPTPSTIVSINLCACCTPHPAPVSSFKFQSNFWVHHLPPQSRLHGVMDTGLSLMLLELHPDLDVVEFLDRRLPAIIRQQVGNRLDRNFVVQIFGISFMRSHLHLHSWTVSHLPECTAADLRRLHAHPLYHHMLYDISHRSEVPVFRNFNLCPIQYLANRPLPMCGFPTSVSPFVNSPLVPSPPPLSSFKSLSGLSNATSTVCSSSDLVCGAHTN